MIVINIDVMLAKRKMSVSELSEKVGFTMANVSLLKNGKIKIHEGCEDAIREFGLYRWDEKAPEDKPIKENDHAMDDIRYMAQTILRRKLKDEETPGIFAL